MFKQILLFTMLLIFASPTFALAQEPRVGDRVGSLERHDKATKDALEAARQDAEFAMRVKNAFAEEEERRNNPRPSGSLSASQYANPSPDYISKKVVPLDAKEKAALALSREFASRQGVKPFLDGFGKVVFTHGATIPIIIGSPMNVCDVELQAGEIINEIILGDAARWLVESGSSRSNIPHLLIKPVDAGLESSAVITTNRRVYHLRLVSQRTGHTQYVGFVYPEDSMRRIVNQQAKEAKEREWNTLRGPDGQTAELSKLNFDYRIRGKAAWKPAQVYDDGRQTFIRLPEKAASGEIPALLVRKGGNEVLVNYRVKDGTMIVDGLFERIILIVGVGNDQEKIEVLRNERNS